MRPMETERYIVFRMPEIGGTDEWYVVWDGPAETPVDAINQAMAVAPVGEFEYRAVAWDDIRCEVVKVERVVTREKVPA